jgi:hypothetical protein
MRIHIDIKYFKIFYLITSFDNVLKQRHLLRIECFYAKIVKKIPDRRRWPKRNGNSLLTLGPVLFQAIKPWAAERAGNQ